jgi:hypothetical protein
MLHAGAALVTVTEAPGMPPDSYNSAEYIELAEQYGAHNYARGSKTWTASAIWIVWPPTRR